MPCYKVRVYFEEPGRPPEDRIVECADDPNKAFDSAVPDQRGVAYAEVYDESDAQAAPVSSRMSVQAVDVLDRFICECCDSKFYLREDHLGGKSIFIRWEKGNSSGSAVVALEQAVSGEVKVPEPVREAARRAMDDRR